MEVYLLLFFGIKIFILLLFLFTILGKAAYLNIDAYFATLYIILKGHKWDKVFKNGPSKIF